MSLPKLPDRYRLVKGGELYAREETGIRVDTAWDVVTGKRVAIKTIPEKAVHKNTLQEILVLQKMRHPHIVQLLDYFEGNGTVGIVMEYVKGGNLYQYVLEKGKIDEPEARRLFQQLVTAVHCLQFHHISHRDIKLDNTLLEVDPTGNNNHTIKLCDFGFAIQESEAVALTKLGTAHYMAPEILSMPQRPGQRGSQQYDPKLSDNWSCGIMLVMMLTGTWPYLRPEDWGPKALISNASNECIDFTEVMRRIQGADYNRPDATPACLELLDNILEPDPRERYTMERIADHPWFQQDLPPGLQFCVDHPLAMKAPSEDAIRGTFEKMWSKRLGSNNTSFALFTLDQRLRDMDSATRQINDVGESVKVLKTKVGSFQIQNNPFQGYIDATNAKLKTIQRRVDAILELLSQ